LRVFSHNTPAIALYEKRGYDLRYRLIEKKICSEKFMNSEVLRFDSEPDNLIEMFQEKVIGSKDEEQINKKFRELSEIYDFAGEQCIGIKINDDIQFANDYNHFYWIRLFSNNESTLKTLLDALESMASVQKILLVTLNYTEMQRVSQMEKFGFENKSYFYTKTL
jgi:hypothetical protein